MIDKLAEHSIYIAHTNNKPITNMLLSRLLFFAVGFTLNNGDLQTKAYISSNYKNEFERWRYGAVCSSVYFKYNLFGYRPISKTGTYFDELAIFNEIILKLLDVSDIQLTKTNLSMINHSKWEDHILSGKFVPNWTLDEIIYSFANTSSIINN